MLETTVAFSCMGGTGLGLLLGLWAGWTWRRSPQPQKAAAAPLTIAPPEPQASLELQLAYQLALEMGQYKAGFLARTAHELRSPLNTLLSSQQLILSGLCDSAEEEREFLNQAHTSAERMVALLDRLIEISKIEQGKSPIKLQVIPVAKILEEVCYMTDLQARNRNLKLDFSIPELSVMVHTEPNWLRQVLVNLVLSALAGMLEGSVRIKTQVDIDRRQVQIIISDDQPAAIWQERIDLLQQPDSRPLQDEGSMGLTLLADQLVLGHLGGSLGLIEEQDEYVLVCEVPLAV